MSREQVNKIENNNIQAKQEGNGKATQMNSQNEDCWLLVIVEYLLIKYDVREHIINQIKIV